MLPASSISSAAHALRALFLQHIGELSDINQIRIGHPGETIKELDDADQNGLNLFYYDVNYDGYPADGASDNPFYVRLHCLITAVGHKTQEPEEPGSPNLRDVSKGENELRLIGEVMRILHEQPLLSIGDALGNEIALLQVVPQGMNLDNLNHIWSTQTDISYRLSVAYEMALAPVPHALPVETAPLAGESQLVSWGAMTRTDKDEMDGAVSLLPTVEYLEVDTGTDGWIPHLCYLEKPDPSTQNLHYVFQPGGDLTALLDILIAGKGAGSVKLYWNLWRRNTDNSIVAWSENIADVVLPADKVLQEPTNASDPFSPARIDPDNIDARSLFQAKLPDAVNDINTKNWQAVLYAVHEWTHQDPPGSGDNITTPVRSNTLLFYGGQS